MRILRDFCAATTAACLWVAAMAVGSLAPSDIASAGPRGSCAALIAAAKKGYRGNSAALADCYARRQATIFDKSKKSYLSDYRLRHHPGEAIQRYYRRHESRQLIEDALGGLLQGGSRRHGGHH
jgi:hypothetical protein